MGLLVFLGVIALVLVYFIRVFNNLVTHRNRFKNAFSQIDVQLQRRYELVPNLVETAKAYLAHERETLSNVIAARNQAISAERAVAAALEDPDKMARLAQAEGALGASLGRLMAVAENYPDLKANQTMQQLMEELASTENRVGFARQAFNDAVMEYNVLREQFPNFFVAGAFGFPAAAQLEIANVEARQPVQVKF
ncbi:MAG: LemA family protein [Moraxellaceae bacterium]|jgi:LemA protein|nr:LemA family protein [Moraxellaceae bacterium]MDF3030352.1 LemA family protein [Moraxellaceae bacterium]